MNLSHLERTIISTLAYYQALGEYPLTSFEIFSRLNAYGERPMFFPLLCALESLREQKTISAMNGFFVLDPASALPNPAVARRGPASHRLPNKSPVTERIRRYKISEGKWKKLRTPLRVLSLLPYIRMIGVTGSLAIDNAHEESDIDLLIVTKPGRIWTSRILCSLATHLLGVRRYRHRIKDRICLNHYLSSDALTLTVQNLSNAHTYAGMIPVFDGGEWYQQFSRENQWINSYIASSPWNLHRSIRYRKRSAASRLIGSFLEMLLQNPAGDLLERALGLLQKQKILSSISPSYMIKTDQLILTSNALMFHYPVSRNAEVEEKYKEIVDNLFKTNGEESTKATNI